MTLEECYVRMGGDYSSVLRRMEKEERVERFLSRFLMEGSYSALCEALADGEVEEAFRAAHSLKGVCMNLGLTPLSSSSAALAEELRGGEFTPAVKILEASVERDYRVVVEAIQEFLNQ